MKLKPLSVLFLLGILGALIVTVVVRRLPHDHAAAIQSAEESAALPTMQRHSAPPAQQLGAAPAQPRIIMGKGTREAARAAFPVIKAEWLDDGRTFITLDTRAAHGLHVGDLFQVDLPDRAHPAVAAITAVTDFHGVRRLTGEFVGTSASTSTFSLAISADIAYAAGQFQLDSDSYSLESNQGAGWLLPADVESGHLLQSEDPTLYESAVQIR